MRNGLAIVKAVYMTKLYIRYQPFIGTIDVLTVTQQPNSLDLEIRLLFLI